MAPSLGYSVGGWDSDALVFTTTHVDFGYFNTIGLPLSRQAEIVEQFAPSDDGSRLDYTMRVTDPATFTAVELEKHWIWPLTTKCSRSSASLDGSGFAATADA